MVLISAKTIILFQEVSIPMSEAFETPQLMYFGYICQECRRFSPLGEIDIEPNAPPSKLHELIQGRNWPDTAISEMVPRFVFDKDRKHDS